MKLSIFKLGTMVSDNVTGTKGMLTHLGIDADRNMKYIYQPRGLNPTTMQPVDRIYLEKSRITGAEFDQVDLPLEALNTQAKDIATGFKGTVIGIVYHINGCVHVEIKPKGIIESTGATIDACEFDIRRVKGDAIPELTEKEKKNYIIQNLNYMATELYYQNLTHIPINERLRIYKKALRKYRLACLKYFIPKFKHETEIGLCYFLFNEFRLEMKDLPELLAQKPKVTKSRGIWFEEGLLFPRIDTLKAAIKMTQQKLKP